jgi:hypothetical protein
MFSALPPKPDIAEYSRHVRNVPRTEVPKYLKTCKSTFRMDNIRRTARADSMLCCEL